MNPEEVRVLALAIAKANGHPDPEGWAFTVVEHWAQRENVTVEPAMFPSTEGHSA